MPTILPLESTLAFYRKHAGDFVKTTANLELSALYDPFLHALPENAHILDAGCGSGRDAKAFMEMGYKITAIDASSEMAQIASRLTGQRCPVLAFQNMEFCSEFNGIWACASLVHVPKAEMRDVLRRFVRAIRAGGSLYVSLTEGEGERISDDGRFFNYYTRESFLAVTSLFPLLEETLFWKTHDAVKRLASTSWLNFLFRKAE